MSANDDPDVCAGCGICAGDSVKLKKCTDCKKAQYCSVACQRQNWSEHKPACREERLFRQPESSHLGDCPICCVPLPLDPSTHSMYNCCSSLLCDGCAAADMHREEEPKCPYCRQPVPETAEEADRNTMKRVQANDPAAIRSTGLRHYEEGDYRRAFEYWSKAAGLGDVEAHYQLSVLYEDGLGVDRNTRKNMKHLEQAAIGGHPSARYNLGVREGRRGRPDRAVRHYVIAATLGHNGSMEKREGVYRKGGP